MNKTAIGEDMPELYILRGRNLRTSGWVDVEQKQRMRRV